MFDWFWVKVGNGYERRLLVLFVSPLLVTLGVDGVDSATLDIPVTFVVVGDAGDGASPMTVLSFAIEGVGEIPRDPTGSTAENRSDNTL